MRRLSISRFAVLACAALSSCGSCQEQPDDPKVPFKLGQGSGSAHVDAGAAPAVPTSDSEALGTSYMPPIDQPELDGVHIPLSIVRASLLTDLDGDGDRDALLLSDDASKKLSLYVALREESAFSEPRAVPTFALTLDPSCTVETVRVGALSASKALAVVGTSCGEPVAVGPQHFMLFSLEAAPRVYQRITLPPASDPARAPELRVESGDADEDGQDDVLLALTLPAADGTRSDPLKLALLDRPSGLVRDAREPESTLSAWASAALGLVAKAPDQAILRAEQVLAMASALCRESGSPWVQVDGAPGFPCGSGKSGQDAALALVLAQAKRGQVAQAFAAYDAFAHGPKKPDAKPLARAHDALRTLPSEKGVTLQEGPRVERVRVPHVHLSPVRFVDENTLFVRRKAAAVHVALDGMVETPAPEASDDLMRDPSGQLAVTDVERTCAGHVLRIERHAVPALDYVPAPPVSMPLIAPFASPPGCTTLPEAERKNRGGFLVLGWAPQGVVAARGAQLFVVPLNLEGKPSGEARMLDPSTPVPAPLPLGAALPDGSVYVEATPFGVLVHQGQAVSLLRPDGYESAVSDPGEAALSPSGRKLVVLSGERVFLLNRSAPSAP
jgi:hypothetical protein